MEQAFDKYSELDQILKFSTPKVLRLVEILRQVRPQNFVDPRKRRDKSENSEATKGVGAPGEGPVSQGGETAIADSEVAVMQDVVDVPKDPSVEVLAKHPRDLEDLDNDDEEKEKSSEKGSPSTQHQFSLTRQKEVLCAENIMNSVQNKEENGGDVHGQSFDEMSDHTGGNTKCNGCVALEDLSHVGTRDTASPCKAFSKQQQEPLALVDEEIPHNGCGWSTPPECSEGREQQPCTTECTINTSFECHANGWSSSQSDSLETLDSTPSVSYLPGKNEEGEGGNAEGEGAEPPHSLKGKSLNNGEVKEKCGEPSKVQIHPDSTQNCCNIHESVVTKQAGSRSTLEEDLCRLNLRESSLRVGCELENSTNCDVNNGTMSAKSHVLDAAKVHSNISAPLCNGYQSGSEESLSSSGETLDKVDSQSSKMEHDGCSTQGEAEECPESPDPSHSVQSDPSDSEVHQHEESSSLTNAQSTTSQPASEAAGTPVQANPNETTTGTDPPSAANNITSPDPQSAASKDTDTMTPAPAAVSSEAAAMADTLALLLPGGKGGRRRRDEVKEKVKVHNPEDPDSVCGLIFVHHRNMAKIIYRLLKVNLMRFFPLFICYCIVSLDIFYSLVHPYSTSKHDCKSPLPLRWSCCTNSGTEQL